MLQGPFGLSQELRPSFESGKALARIAGRLPYWIIFIMHFAFARRPKIYPALAKRQCKGSLKTKNNPIGKSARDARQRLAAFERRSELLR